jgi:uridine phosphorylase
MDKNFKPEHINANHDDFMGNGHVGRYIFFPGSDSRAKSISERFKNLKVKQSSRGHNLYMGEILDGNQKIDVASISSGMGTPSLDIILNEVLKLGSKRILRVGSSGSLQHDRVKLGHMVIATASVRDEGASRCYVPPEYPAVASIDMVEASIKAARKLNFNDRVHTGIIHSKDSLYGREFEEGPMKIENTRYMKILMDAGVLASEMEASMLFTLSSLYDNEISKKNKKDRVLSGTVCMIISAGPGFVDEKTMKMYTNEITDLAIHTFFELNKNEKNLLIN